VILRLICAGFLLISGLVGQTTAPTNEITVRLIDIRSGQVVTDEEVNVQFHTVGNAHLQRLDGKTGPDGTVKFHLSEPIPSTILVMASTKLYPCYSLFPIETERLLREGMLSRCSKPSQGCHCKFKPQLLESRYKAGELVLPVRHFTNGEKLR
jgi:hypothetical protein